MKILVANRGEIAVRILRACREMGVPSVAVFSVCDRTALHVGLADEAVAIGASPAAESYLNIERVIAAARATSATAVHPGYGFLAENAEFVRRCEEEGITFIGPSSEVIRNLGDKIEARRLMQEAGLPVAAGSDEPVSNADEAAALATEIGYPVILKAAAGGGGIGMQIVNNAGEFDSALKSCQSRAASAFGDDRVFLEKFIEGAQHIEFQVLADGTDAVHFGERFCSIQRRHQKLLEEGPWLSDEVRAKIGELVCEGARSVGYRGLATFEFLRDSSGEFNFLEVNPRVQVEHTVTEMLTGHDLVSLGIRVASGESLPLSQEDIHLSGHAIQCRINAEDPRQFSPSPGRLWDCHFPAGFGVRVDTHAHVGYDMPGCFDSLLAKLIVWGPDRERAIAGMRSALAETTLIGVETVIPLHQAIMDEPDFQARRVTIAYLDEHPNLL